ncbi:hypothetical protein TFLX_00379 [Thermoflexales bacterium]|nr:hypothetical protein TFLX_00379 [Thermoflexales bacterium]
MKRSVSSLLLALIFTALIIGSLTLPDRAAHATTADIIINIRRDASAGLPYGGAHSAGMSSIVWGSTSANTPLTFTLAHIGGELVTRTMTTDGGGYYAVSLDRLIADDDVLSVTDGSQIIVVPVASLTFQVDREAKRITGSAPGGITSTSASGPHSLQLRLAGTTRQISTTLAGSFSVSVADLPYLAGLLGSLRYTTPSGQNIYKPLFIVDPFVRGQSGDGWADKILGQPDYTQITPNQVVGNRTFNPGSVYVDRSVQPNRVYVLDASNSRILGLSHLGVCAGGSNVGQVCTTHSDCPGSTCPVQTDRAADIVLGQPAFNTSACNGDSAYQLYPDVPQASAATFCDMREEQLSILETGTGATLASDAAGNLYVPDLFNNRILRYNSPFTTDQIADEVWGQDDFAGITCNRGAGYGSLTDNRSLCLAPPPGRGEDKAGVALDPAGNLWVTDNQNHRVLRFPFNAGSGQLAKEADLVLGQANFRSRSSGSGLHQMNYPEGIRVTGSYTVYVADRVNHRLLVFTPPFTNGMSAHHALTTGLNLPMSLEFDATGLWISDASGHITHYTNEVPDRTISVHANGNGIGVDRDGNVLFASSGPVQSVQRFISPTYTLDAEFLDSNGLFNQTGPFGFSSGKGLELTADQLIYGDSQRILFWNHPETLHDYQPADGVIGQPDFHSRGRWQPIYERLRAHNGYLWALNSGAGGPSAVILAYPLPLTSGMQPALIISSPLPLAGGGVFTWTRSMYMGGIDFQPGSNYLWLADEENHRAFRIRNPQTQPMVDVVIGQLNPAGTLCNQGRGQASPSQDSLCHPGALAFDAVGNLYLSDHNLEFDGNHRLLEYDASSLPEAPVSAVFGIPATRVFGRGGSFTRSTCMPSNSDPLCGPFEPSFDQNNRMVIGFNQYVGGPRFPLIYQNILTNPLPIMALGDLHSMPTSNRFDVEGNLYILDHNRNRILIYDLTPEIADLAMSKRVTPLFVQPGQAITYTLAFSNAGNGVAAGVLITDLCPSGSITDWSYAASLPVTPTGNISYSWQVGDLAPGAGGVITLTGIVSADLQGWANLSNTALITSTAAEANPSNNSSSANVIFHYRLQTNVSGGGRVTRSPDQPAYLYGEVVTLTAVPATSWIFTNWRGDLIGSLNPVTLTLDRNQTVTGTFACPPITAADFAFTPLIPRGGQAVNFTAVITGGLLPFTYTWIFGDGSTALTTTTRIQHDFPVTNTLRTYTVTLTSTNACSSQLIQKPIGVQPYRVYLPLLLKGA